MSDTLKIAVLLSGGGRTLANLAEQIDGGALAARIVLVIASRSDAYGQTRAVELGLATSVLNRKDHADRATYSRQVFDQVRGAGAELVCLCGWLSLLEIPDDYARRVVNIHPALLPDFGGSGMYGRHVHEAVLAAGVEVSGCTVHFADNAYDTGPLILQRTCEVRGDDTPESLAARVFEQECIAYPEAIRMIAEGRVHLEDGRVRVE